MLNLKSQELNIPQDPGSFRDNMTRLLDEVKGVAYPCERFLGFPFDVQLEMHLVTVLVGWGFQLRYGRLATPVVERFLRTRMRHFDHDIPHPALFGEPPGDWPQL